MREFKKVIFNTVGRVKCSDSVRGIYIYIQTGSELCKEELCQCAVTTGPDGAVVNGLVGTGFASRYRLQPRAGF